MKAFGPFADTIQVSFDRVFDGGLFLIHGRTGAGKTSLLDGLCFSLFGRPSSEEREKDLRGLRSDLAAPEVMTETELIFTIGPIAYRVHRIPTQMAPKKRGEGFTEHKGSAELYRFEGSIDELRAALQPANAEGPSSDDVAKLAWVPMALKVEAVDAAIENLVGMNERQFRQVVILPQGRFREFLSSSSTERQAILEKLFQTDRFSRLQQYISGLKRSTEGRLSQAGESLQSRLAHFGLEKPEDIAPHRQALNEKAKTEGAKLEQLRLQTDTLTQELNIAKEFELAQNRYRALQGEAKTLQAQAPVIEETKARMLLGRAWLPFFQIEDLKRAVDEKYRELTNRQAELNSNRALLQKRKTTASENHAKLQAAKPTLEEIISERSRLRELVGPLKEIAATHRQIENESRQNDKIKTEIEDLTSRIPQMELDLRSALRGLIAIDENERGQEAKRIETEDRKIKELELKFHHSEAARLALILSPGSPCPVCGSTEHPRPADRVVTPTVNGQSVTAAFIQEERLKFDRLRHQLAEGRLSRQSRLEPLLEELQDLDQKETATLPAVSFSAQVKIFDAASAVLRQSKQAIEVQSAEWRARTQATETTRLALAERLATIPIEDRSLEDVMKRGLELKSEQERREPLLKEIDKEIRDVTLELSRTEGTLTALADELTRLGAESADIQRKLKTLQPEGPRPNTRLEDRDLARIGAEIEGFAQAQTRNAAALEEVAQRLASKTSTRAPDVIAGELTSLTRERSELEQQVARLRVEIEGMTKLEAEAGRALEALSNLKEEAARAGRMSALLTGDKSQNKLLVPLSRFVLQSRFEDVLEQANRRLSRMSRGQFQLRRPALSRNLRDSQGLELTVEDSVAGKERHAGSLSGGESFMAALSLALGLADVVQADLGGVRLDSVLIDEGFGTLDSESLDLAMKTLVDLQAGGRIVGIISHVQELKTQVHHQLEVGKSVHGSSVRWNHDVSN